MTNWSECSQKCGGGFQTRRLECRSGDKRVALSICQIKHEFLNRTCNTHPCSEGFILPTIILRN